MNADKNQNKRDSKYLRLYCVSLISSTVIFCQRFYQRSSAQICGKYSFVFLRGAVAVSPRDGSNSWPLA
jgi:hypothetical protein